MQLETWLTNNCSIAPYQLPNYNFVSGSKSYCQHGSLLMYIHDSLKYEIRDESENISNWECLSVKILDNIYNKPYTTVEHFDLFLSQFTSFIDKGQMKLKKKILSW